MQVITLVNEKGGVAKTTCAVTIAAGLAIEGKRTVLVDADPQGHAGLMLGIAKEPGLYDLLVRHAPFKNVLRHVSPEVYERPGGDVKGQLFILPSNVETRNIANSISDANAVSRRFRELAQSGVDVIVVDTPPTPSLLHGSIYMATDMVLYPTKLEALSFDGLQESLQHKGEADDIRTGRNMSAIHILGIVPTIFRHETLEHRENLEDLRENFGDQVWSPVPESTIWAEMSRLQRPVWSFAPKSSAAKHAWEMVQNTMKALVNA